MMDKKILGIIIGTLLILVGVFYQNCYPVADRIVCKSSLMFLTVVGIIILIPIVFLLLTEGKINTKELLKPTRKKIILFFSVLILSVLGSLITPLGGCSTDILIYCDPGSKMTFWSGCSCVTSEEEFMGNIIRLPIYFLLLPFMPSFIESFRSTIFGGYDHLVAIPLTIIYWYLLSCILSYIIKRRK